MKKTLNLGLFMWHPRHGWMFYKTDGYYYFMADWKTFPVLFNWLGIPKRLFHRARVWMIFRSIQGDLLSYWTRKK